MGPEQWTILGLVGSITAAGIAKLWVFGWIYSAEVARSVKELADMTEDRNFWRDTALQALGHTDKALDVARSKKA